MLLTVRVDSRTALFTLMRNIAGRAAMPLLLGAVLAACSPERADEPAARAPEREIVVAQSAALPSPAPASGLVDAQRLRNAEREPGNWLMDGRTYSAQRYSPLALINEQNIGELGLAWYYDLETLRGVEATPLAIDGDDRVWIEQLSDLFVADQLAEPRVVERQ